jgi:hypothetical protein
MKEKAVKKEEAQRDPKVIKFRWFECIENCSHSECPLAGEVLYATHGHCDPAKCTHHKDNEEEAFLDAIGDVHQVPEWTETSSAKPDIVIESQEDAFRASLEAIPEMPWSDDEEYEEWSEEEESKHYTEDEDTRPTSAEPTFSNLPVACLSVGDIVRDLKKDQQLLDEVIAASLCDMPVPGPLRPSGGNDSSLAKKNVKNAPPSAAVTPPGFACNFTPDEVRTLGLTQHDLWDFGYVREATSSCEPNHADFFRKSSGPPPVSAQKTKAPAPSAETKTDVPVVAKPANGGALNKAKSPPVSAAVSGPPLVGFQPLAINKLKPSLIPAPKVVKTPTIPVAAVVPPTVCLVASPVPPMATPHPLPDEPFESPLEKAKKKFTAPVLAKLTETRPVSIFMSGKLHKNQDFLTKFVNKTLGWLEKAGVMQVQETTRLNKGSSAFTETVTTDSNVRKTYRFGMQSRTSDAKIDTRGSTDTEFLMKGHNLVMDVPIYPACLDILRSDPALRTRRALDSNGELFRSMMTATNSVLNDGDNADRTTIWQEKPEILVYTIVHYLNQMECEAKTRDMALPLNEEPAPSRSSTAPGKLSTVA